MSIVLEIADRDEVFARTHQRFADFPMFFSLASGNLQGAIAKAISTKLNLKKKANSYYSAPLNKDEELAVEHARLIVMCGLVEVLARTDEGKAIMEAGMNEFTNKYNAGFVELDADFSLDRVNRVEFLYKFWKYTKVTLLGMPAQWNKKRFLGIAGRMADYMSPLVTGSGQSKLVDCCVLIYETEGFGTSARPNSLPTRTEQEDRKPHPANAVTLTEEQIARLTGQELAAVPSILLPAQPEPQPEPQPASQTPREFGVQFVNLSYEPEFFLLPMDDPYYEGTLSDFLSAEALSADTYDPQVYAAAAHVCSTPVRASAGTYSDTSMGNTTVDANSDCDAAVGPTGRKRRLDGTVWGGQASQSFDFDAQFGL